MLKKLGFRRSALVFVTALALLATTAQAGGVFSTDRFGYTGVVTRYGSQTDAENGINALDVINIQDVAANNTFEHRDASFYFVNDAGAYDTNYNVLMGSWWYSVSGSAGYGNINGNTGVGFMQLYDGDGSTDTSVNMGFDNFNGSYWTDYTLQVTGSNATAANDYSRFSVYDNVYDSGTYLNYNLNITATGLQGVQTGDVIEANNHATGVTGTFTGLFQLSDSSPAGPNAGLNNGFYTIALTFDMDNWAFANNGSLNGDFQDGGNIYESLFVETGVPVVPVPAAAGLGFLGMSLVGILRRRKRTTA